MTASSRNTIQELKQFSGSDDVGMLYSSASKLDDKLTETPAIDIEYKDTNIRELHALIVGPPETPYALGFYQVNLRREKTRLK